MKGVFNIESLNIYQKLAKIRAISDVAQKNLSGYGYKYASLAEILAKVTAGMKKYNVSLIPHIVPGTGNVVQNVVVNTKTDKTGRTYENKSTEMLFTGEMVYTWVNDENPDEKIDVPWYVTGAQSDPSQSFGTGTSYATRQFLTNFFQIAMVEDDVDGYRSKQKAAEATEAKAIAEGIIGQVDTLVKTYLADNPDKTDDIKKFMTRYVKNANYLAIKDPEFAAKLLQDFRTTYLGEEVKE